MKFICVFEIVFISLISLFVKAYVVENSTLNTVAVSINSLPKSYHSSNNLKKECQKKGGSELIYTMDKKNDVAKYLCIGVPKYVNYRCKDSSFILDSNIPCHIHASQSTDYSYCFKGDGKIKYEQI